MIERRFAFRGRKSQNERYRAAWIKLVIRARIDGQVALRFNDKYLFLADAIYCFDGEPCDSLALEVRITGQPIAGLTKPTDWPHSLRTVDIIVDDAVSIRRRFKPAISAAAHSRVRLVLLRQTEHATG